LSSQRVFGVAHAGHEFWPVPLYVSRIPGAGRLQRWLDAGSYPRDPRIGRNHPPYGGRFERRRPSWPVIRHYWYRR
jgi:hypothetical protein